MDDAIKAAWKDKLMSGDFPQGQGWLRSWNPSTEKWAYCCLGVACEISGLGKWVEFTSEDGVLVSSYLGADQYLPAEVAEWMGLENHHDEGTPQAVFADMNDCDKSFEIIANNVDAVLDGTYDDSSDDDDTY